MLFPTIRFAIFFLLVMPASWMLMPLPSRWDSSSAKHDHGQPWIVPAGMIGAAALLGPLAPSDGWPAGLRAVLWLAALALAVLAVVRWLDLTGLTRWNVFILIASYVFYGNYDWRFVAVLAGSTVVNQALAGLIDRSGPDRTRKAWLALALALNLGVLGWFKYKGFFIESASSILEPLGFDITPPARALIPPVGISFFTFQALSYVIDTYRRKLHPVPLLEFAVYLSFFPHLVAGPIVRAAEFLPQLRVPRDARRVDSGLAFWLISVGLFKKVVVSSYLADAIVDPVFRIPQQHQALDTLLGIYGYAIQIYCDFSGYTDMAIGLALLLGFRFPQNFDAPYTAASLQDFWRRWHMTLSRWLRDYLYIPLGGNQLGANRAMVNLFLTMVIGGLWHGAAWTFIVWGALHGGWLAGERMLRDRGVRRDAAEVAPRQHDDDGLSELVPIAGMRAGPPTHPGEPTRAGQPAPATGRRERFGATVRPDRGSVDLVDARHAAQQHTLPTLSGLSPTSRLWLGRVVTFNVVCLGWVFFRSPSLTEAFAVLGRLTDLGTGTGVNVVVLAVIVVFLGSQFVPGAAVGKAQALFSRRPAWQQGVALAAWLALTNALAPAGVAPFIYFAF